jgi:hypothetical protein
MVIGDALYPYVADLAPAHKKLLTIYIEKHQRNKTLAKANLLKTLRKTNKTQKNYKK